MPSTKQKERETSYLDFLEYVDYLAQAGKKVMIDTNDPAFEPRGDFVPAWLRHLEEKKLIRILAMPKAFEEAPVGTIDTIWTIEVQEGLKKYVNEVYSWNQLNVENLSTRNFLAVLETAMQIREKLQVRLTDQVTIPIMPKVIYFKGLLPMDSDGHRNEYVDYKYEALTFLKETGAITDFQANEGMQRWDTLITVSLERRYFDAIFRGIGKRGVEEGWLRSSSSSDEQEESGRGVKTKQPKKAGSSKKVKSKPSFNAQASELRFGDKVCRVPDATIEYYICKLTFQANPNKVEETDIIEKAGTSDESKQSVYDARRRLNAKAKQKLGVSKLFEYKAAKVWLNPNLFR